MDSTLACLADWMPRQRWYAAKGRTPRLRLVGEWDLPASEPGAESAVRVRTLLIADDGTVPPAVYQVPVVARPSAVVEESAAHVIGSPVPGTTLVDGAYDPAYTAAVLQLVTHGGEAAGPGTIATGVPAASSPAVTRDGSGTVLSGEQSNTSLVYPAAGAGVPVICKIFRQVHPGTNPDIELQTALADAGSDAVPRAVGSIEGRWPDPADPSRTIGGSLAFAQEFLPGVEDAWRVALRAVAAGEDFTERAGDLGRATARVHVSLADIFGAREASSDDRAAAVLSWTQRLAVAVAELPDLAPWRTAIETVYARAAAAPWPRLQRIHGDYHLGQVILVPGRGWVLLDFEGEPMRPMAERVLPDLAPRDVAGMLRSFDYVAGSLALDDPHRAPDAVRAWAQDARTAFLEGYAEEAGADPDAHRDLLDALELDKAVYEAIYESRNRPSWVEIPLQAVARLAAR